MVAYLNTTILVICLHVREAQRLREHDMRLFATPANNVRLDMHASRSTDRSAHRALRSASSRCRMCEWLDFILGDPARRAFGRSGIGYNLQVRSEVPVLVEGVIWLSGGDVHGDVV